MLPVLRYPKQRLVVKIGAVVKDRLVNRTSMCTGASLLWNECPPVLRCVLYKYLGCTWLDESTGMRFGVWPLVLLCSVLSYFGLGLGSDLLVPCRLEMTELSLFFLKLCFCGTHSSLNSPMIGGTPVGPHVTTVVTNNEPAAVVAVTPAVGSSDGTDGCAVWSIGM